MIPGWRKGLQKLKKLNLNRLHSNSVPFLQPHYPSNNVPSWTKGSWHLQLFFISSHFIQGIIQASLLIQQLRIPPDLNDLGELESIICSTCFRTSPAILENIMFPWCQGLLGCLRSTGTGFPSSEMNQHIYGQAQTFFLFPQKR
jgi:hypothetical protein